MSNDASGFPTPPNEPDGPATPPAPDYGQQPAVPDYGQQAPAPEYGQQPPAPEYGQQPPPGAVPPPGAPADYGQPGQAAPQYAPQPGYAQPAPGQPDAMGYAAPPGYVAAGAGMVKAPRPDVKVGAILVLAGAIITILAAFLPWASANGNSANGMDNYTWIEDFTFYDLSSPAAFPIGLAVVMGAFGVTLLLAGRVLAVAIIAIVGAAIAIIVGLAMWGLMMSFADSVGGSVGIGAILQPIAPLLSLGGAITATAKRRKMVPAEPGQAPQFG